MDEEGYLTIDDATATYISILVHQLSPGAANLLAKQLYVIETRFPLEGNLRTILSRDAVFETVLRYGVSLRGWSH